MYLLVAHVCRSLCYCWLENEACSLWVYSCATQQGGAQVMQLNLNRLKHTYTAAQYAARA